MIYDQTAPFYDLFDADDPGALWHREFVLTRAAGLDAALDIGAGTGRTAFALAERVGCESIVAPGVGLKDGILAELVDRAFRVWDERGEQAEVEAEALELGRKYRFDEAHALHVAEMSASLFDQLADLPDVEPSFIEHCRHRETAGRDEFGHAFLDRENCLEGLEEAADLAIYSELHLLRCRREGKREQTELALEAARLAALAYVALARLHHAS